MTRWKTCEIGVRQGANRSQVRPRTAEQGPHSWGCDPIVGCKRTEVHRVLMHTYAVASPQAGPLLHAAVRRRFWLQPFGLARVLACSPRLSAKGFCCWGGDGGRMAHIHSVVYGAVPANGPAANESRRHVVEKSLA